jgi:hypothetical protein
VSPSGFPQAHAVPPTTPRRHLVGRHHHRGRSWRSHGARTLTCCFRSVLAMLAGPSVASLLWTGLAMEGGSQLVPCSNGGWAPADAAALRHRFDDGDTLRAVANLPVFPGIVTTDDKASVLGLVVRDFRGFGGWQSPCPGCAGSGVLPRAIRSSHGAWHFLSSGSGSLVHSRRPVLRATLSFLPAFRCRVGL